jgi:hypothetical protein
MSNTDGMLFGLLVRTWSLQVHYAVTGLREELHDIGLDPVVDGAPLPKLRGINRLAELQAELANAADKLLAE